MSTTHPIRVIAKLDIKGPNLIKGLQLDGHRVLGRAEQFAEIYYGEADELFYQDTVASLYNRNGLLEVISETAKKAFIPLTVAGGIRSIADIREVLRAGADKVAINTYATQNPEFLAEAARIFGSQCIVSSIEAYRKEDGRYHVWVDYGREPTQMDAFDWAKRVEDAGVGEILVTSINNDGMGWGYDLELIERIASQSSLPVLACGGASKKEDFVPVVKEAGASAVVAASVFHYRYAIKQDGKLTMSYNKPALRMGEHIDSGNIDFLNFGYGGTQAIMVEPTGINEVKQHMRDSGITVRLSK